MADALGLYEVVGNSDVIPVTLSMNAAANHAGDVLADTQEIAGAARSAGKSVVLQSITLDDIDDQKPALEIIFFNANTSLGTENAAPDIDDTEVLTVIGRVSIAATDWLDLGGASIACKTNLGLLLEPASASTSLYFAVMTSSAPTPTAAGIKVYFGFLRD